MLEAKKRLKKRKDIEALFQSGVSCYADCLGVKAMPNVLVYPRVLVIISKKVSKRAVVRNRLKRQLMSLMYQKQKELKNVDLAIIVNAAALNKEFVDLEKALDFCLRKLHLYAR